MNEDRLTTFAASVVGPLLFAGLLWLLIKAQMPGEENGNDA